MTLTEAMKEIESHAFAVRVNLASDYKTFLRAVQQEESAQTILKELPSSRNRLQLVNRIARLANQLVDSRYENPWDVAFAVYLWLLDLHDPIFSKIAAQSVAQAPQCWWSRTISKQILKSERLRSDAGVNQQEARLNVSDPKVLAQALDASETILSASFYSHQGLMQFVNAVADRKSSTAPFLHKQWGLPTSKYSLKNEALTAIAA